MKFNYAGQNLLETCEGCKLEAYQDERGIWTIGYGHTGPEVKPGMTCTLEAAEAQLFADANKFSIGVAAQLIGSSLQDNQFSALVCLSFNIGLAAFAGSSACHLVHTGPYVAMPAHIKMWNKVEVDGKLVTSPGLVWRRNCECALWELADGNPVPSWDQLR